MCKKKTLRDYRVGRNLELHQVLHKDISLLKQTWKDNEVAELNINQMGIDSIYIKQALNCIKH